MPLELPEVWQKTNLSSLRLFPIKDLQDILNENKILSNIL